MIKTQLKITMTALGALTLLAHATPAAAFGTTHAPTAETTTSNITHVSAPAAELTGAQAAIEALSNDGIAFLKDPSLSNEARTSKFRQLLTSKFDINRIGRFSMGRYWRDTNKAQQGDYKKLFKEMLVQIYSKRFSDYQGQELIVGEARAQGEKDIIVHSNLVSPGGGPKVSVDWRVRKTGKNYKVIDVIVEGVSMAVTQRSEFASIIQRGGGDVQVLIDYLKENQ